MDQFTIIVGIFGMLGAIAAVVALFWNYSRAPQTAPPAGPDPIGAVPGVCNLPWPRNPLFTGRVEIMDQLTASLDSTRSAVLTQAVAGEGGVGKTAIALEYCHRSRDRYDVIWWIRSEPTAVLRADFTNLAARLGLTTHALADDETVAMVRHWLSAHPRWLLVFDNVTEPEDARKYIPAHGSGHVIITSRRQDWTGLAQKVEVKVMSPEDAVKFLLVRADIKKPSDKDMAEAGELAQTLGYLPLALEQAGAFIALVPGFRHYRERFEKESVSLFGRDDQVLNYEKTVWTTYNVSLEATRTKTLAGVELMNLMAFFAPDNIPLNMIKNGAEHLPQALADDARDVRHFDQDLKILSAYSLLKLDEDTASLHRLLQAVIRQRMSISEQKTWAAAALNVVNEAFPNECSDVREWPKCKILYEHALAAAGYAEELKTELEAVTRLLNQAGVYLLSQANFSESEHLMRWSLAIDEASLGPDHPNVAIRLNNLASLLQDTNRLSEAEPLMRRALEIDEASLGPDHPEVATALNNLASLLQATNRLYEAEPMMRRALAIDEASFGPDHTDVATDLNNLASLLQDTNRLDEAETLMSRVVDIFTKSFGESHPNVATAINNLATLLQATNRFSEAEPMIRRALAIDEASLGPDHPNVARDLNNLAQLLQDTNRLSEAEPMMRRALEIDETSFGPDHPNVAIRLNNLAQLLRATNRLAEAEPQMRRALAIDETSLGPDHPKVATDLNNLAQLLKATNRLAEAEPLMRRAYEIFKGSYGEDHPKTVIVRDNLRALEAKLNKG